MSLLIKKLAKMKRILYILTGLMVLTVSCQKDKYYLFNDVGRIQFGPNPNLLYRSGAQLMDTVKNYTFYYDGDNVKEDTVYFDVYTVGGITSHDRKFKLEQVQVDGVMNATADKHYVGFSNQNAMKNFVIKADSVHCAVPIVLLRDPSLKDTNVVLKFQVVENEDFKLGEVANLWREVGITDRLSQPNTWDANFSRYYFGEYSVVKHRFMIDSTGQKWDDSFIVEIRSDYSLLQYWIGVCKTALIKYNNQHPGQPLRDEYRQLIIFP